MLQLRRRGWPGSLSAAALPSRRRLAPRYPRAVPPRLPDRGISLPFQITPGASDIVDATGVDLRRERGNLVLGTRASGGPDVGEIAWDPSRGSRLDLLRHTAASDAAGDVAAVYIDEAFRQIPGERLREVTVTVDAETILIEAQSLPSADVSPTAKTVTVSTTIRR